MNRSNPGGELNLFNFLSPKVFLFRMSEPESTGPRVEIGLMVLHLREVFNYFVGAENSAT